MESSIWDRPVTDKELDQFYGRDISQQEKEMAIGAAASDFDDGEIGDVCAIAFEQIADLIASGDAEGLGNYIMFLRRQRIADIASRRVFGKVGMIFAKEVKV